MLLIPVGRYDSCDPGWYGRDIFWRENLRPKSNTTQIQRIAAIDFRPLESLPFKALDAKFPSSCSFSTGEQDALLDCLGKQSWRASG